jgi:DnaK suppressor protein
MRATATDLLDLRDHRLVLEAQWRHHVTQITVQSIDLYDAHDEGGDDAAAGIRFQETAERIAAERYALKEVEAALARIDEGSYGRCEQCGSMVSPARLDAVPHARYCSGCHTPG